jgi:hypothetical protein
VDANDGKFGIRQEQAIVRHMGLKSQPLLAAALPEVSTERGYIIPSGLTTLPVLQ